mmetsp:Transcript_33467/g.85503  ORF Transcript_33467/g.85503 Transcript_33467/m.85503 type:complete len:251 (+) Transcript_33467:180-932(+)
MTPQPVDPNELRAANCTAERFTHMLIDLDDTLYQVPSMPAEVLQRIQGYMREKLRVPEERVKDECLHLYLSHGTTLAGLVAQGHDIDYDDWHANVHHQLPYQACLQPDPALRELLDSIPLSKWIFTNADHKHAEICLNLLGLQDCFQGIISFESIMRDAAKKGMLQKDRKAPVICKPSHKAFDLALEEIGATPCSTIFLDDSVRNVTSAQELGLEAVLVKHGEGHWSGPTIPDMQHLKALMPCLWKEDVH